MEEMTMDQQFVQKPHRHLQVKLNGVWRPFCQANPFEVVDSSVYHGWPWPPEVLCMVPPNKVGLAPLEEMKKIAEEKYKLVCRIEPGICPSLE